VTWKEGANDLWRRYAGRLESGDDVDVTIIMDDMETAQA